MFRLEGISRSSRDVFSGWKHVDIGPAPSGKKYDWMYFLPMKETSQYLQFHLKCPHTHSTNHFFCRKGLYQASIRLASPVYVPMCVTPGDYSILQTSHLYAFSVVCTLRWLKGFVVANLTNVCVSLLSVLSCASSYYVYVKRPYCKFYICMASPLYIL